MTTSTVSADISVRIKQALAQDLRESRLSRAQIADELSKLSGRSINESHLDAYAAESKAGYRFPAELIPVWVKVTGSRRVIDLVCGELGLHLADETEGRLAELGRAQIQREQLDEKLKTLRADLWTKA